MSYSLDTLEFNIIKSKIEKYTYSSHAKEHINNLSPAKNFSEAKSLLNETNELVKINAKYGKIPFLSYFDNTIFINKFVLRNYDITEFLYLRLFINMTNEILKYYKTFKDEFNLKYTYNYFNLFENKYLNERLNIVFNDQGEINDNASNELLKIRKDILKKENELNSKITSLLKKYQNYLSEDVITIRNNRPCLSVKEGSKNRVKGIIHDVSNSKQTVFIEPMVSVEINREIEILKNLEKKEIEKILKELSNLVNESFNDYKNNLNILINLDIINSKALYSLNTNGILPNLNNEGIIDLIDAKHPLIDNDKVVPISLKLNNENNTLLITGPNTGGKTVTLKTVGLLTVMLLSGILIQVNEESNLSFFDNVFVDIGDEQSILNSLSTFSSHITKIIYFIKNITNKSLVLLDELGSGTDPNEGVALAISIIEEIRKYDIRLIVTSHFSELKTYAYEKEGINLASVDFDVKTLKPLYKLRHGIVGQSHARLIAKRLGMKDSVINKANELFLERESELSKIINKLNIEKEELEKEKEQIRLLENKYNEEITKLNETKEILLNEQNVLLKRIREKEEEKWNKKILEVNNLIKEIEKDKKNIKEHKIADLKGKINVSVKDKEIVNINEKLNVSDLVYIIPYQQYGHIKEINGKNYLVNFGNFDLTFKRTDLRLEKREQKPKKIIKPKRKETLKHDYDKTGSMRVDLRGFRYEEVKEELDKRIDQALLSNIATLTIIHGYGTFVVKKAVDDYIRNSNLIKSSREGGEGEGLKGVTIINLK